MSAELFLAFFSSGDIIKVIIYERSLISFLLLFKLFESKLLLTKLLLSVHLLFVLLFVLSIGFLHNLNFTVKHMFYWAISSLFDDDDWFALLRRCFFDFWLRRLNDNILHLLVNHLFPAFEVLLTRYILITLHHYFLQLLLLLLFSHSCPLSPQSFGLSSSFLFFLADLRAVRFDEVTGLHFGSR